MLRDDSLEYLTELLHELCSLPAETEWAEFKHNNADPNEIGEYLSALANSAALNGKVHAYLVWGIDDATHAVIGTSFRAAGCKTGNEELESWLLRLLQPRIHFRFHEFQVDGKAICLLEIQRAVQRPVQFKNIEYIRVGSYKKKLKDHPAQAVRHRGAEPRAGIPRHQRRGRCRPDPPLQPRKRLPTPRQLRAVLGVGAI